MNCMYANCIHPNAKLHPSVIVGAYSHIYGDVEIGEGSIIDDHVTIYDGVRIGKGCHIYAGAQLGNPPHDQAKCSENNYTIIGDNTVIREYVTINNSILDDGTTIIGSDCFIMAYCHISHDCKLGDHIIMANYTHLDNNVVVDHWAKFGGGSKVHSCVHIGSYALIQGGICVDKDIPPYILVAREPIVYCGLNYKSLSRSAFTQEQLLNIKRIYNLLYSSNMNIDVAIEKIEHSLLISKECSVILEFIKNSKSLLSNN